MAEQLTPDDVLRLRMRAQGLERDPAAGADAGTAGAGPDRIAAEARRMLALQGQDWRSARWALGARVPGSTAADVATAFDRGLIVRSWPMRGTVHITAAEDIGWMQRATARRVLAGAAKRREFLGIDDPTLDRLVEVSLAALAGTGARADRPGLDRDELADAWTGAGIDWRSNWRYHLIWWLCQNGLAVLGPTGSDGEPRLVAAAEWIPAPRNLDGVDALAELAVRHAAARGPVRAKDLAWWTGLPLGEARAGLAAAVDAGRLVEVRALDDAGDAVGGAAGALWADPELLGSPAPRAPEGPGGWRLLAAFDEHLLGYADREPQLAPEHFERIVPGRNGMFLATVVHGGRVVGTWRRAAGGGSRAPLRLELTAFPGRRLDRRALAPALAEWAAFHGVERAEFAPA